MKYLLLIVCTVLWLPRVASGQSREILLEKLHFVYHDDPSLPLAPTAVELDKVRISRGQTAPGAFGSHADNEGLRSLVKALLCTTAKGGDARLQRIAATIIAITDKPVIVMLYRDEANRVHHPTLHAYSPAGAVSMPTHPNACWINAGELNGGSHAFAGIVGIGSHYYHPNTMVSGATGARQKKGMFLHELLHTQMSVRAESWLSPLPQYGSDGTHFFPELLPSANAAFEEGLANAFALYYQYNSSLDIINNLNGNQWMIAENEASCTAAGKPCIQQRLSANSVTTISSTCETNYQCYDILDISPDLIGAQRNILYQRPLPHCRGVQEHLHARPGGTQVTR